MKTRSSIIDYSLSDYFFAVYPISIKFERQYKTKFYLYFEKSLQIISKHESPVEAAGKDEIIHFLPPKNIQHFRIQSEKNLDYQWSMYIYRVDVEGDNEEFVEGQKITLKNEWTDYKLNKKGLYESTINFNRIRCKLTYMILIGNSNEEIFDSAQKYFNQIKTSVITSDEKVILPEQTLEPVKLQEGVKPEGTAEPAQHAGNRQSKCQITIQATAEPQVKSSQKIQQLKVSGKMQKEQHIQNQEPVDAEPPVETNNRLSLGEEENHKLSNSDILIGNQIEEKIQDKEGSVRLGEQTQGNDGKAAGDGQTQNGQKNIRMTSSQLYNEKGQLIVPWFKNKKILLAITLLVILLLGGGFWSLKNSRKQVGKKGRQEAIQKGGKKTQGKQQAKKPTKNRK